MFIRLNTAVFEFWLKKTQMIPKYIRPAGRSRKSGHAQKTQLAPKHIKPIRPVGVKLIPKRVVA